MTKNKIIVRWIIYAICLIAGIILFIFLNNNLTFSILLLIAIIPILSLVYLLILKCIIKIEVGFNSEFDINEDKKTFVKLNKKYFLLFISYKIKYKNMNIENDEYLVEEYNFLNFQKELDFDLNIKLLGKYSIEISEFRIEDIFNLFSFKIKYNFSDSFLVLSDFEKLINSFNDLNIENESFKKITSYEFSNEYDELKKYNIGDPLNLINWKVSLKNDDMFVKVKTRGTNSNLIIILDNNSINKENYNDFINKYISTILILLKKEIIFDIGIYSIKNSKFLEIEAHDINYIVKFIFDNLLIEYTNIDILNYYKNNTVANKNIIYISNKKIFEPGVLVI